MPKQSDSIFIEGLKTQCVIGVHAWEKAQTQPIILDIELFGSVMAAGESDQLADTIDYFEVSQQIINFTQASQFNLIEALAEQLCRLILNQHPAVQAIQLRLNKPQAIPSAQATGIKLYRQR